MRGIQSGFFVNIVHRAVQIRPNFAYVFLTVQRSWRYTMAVCRKREKGTHASENITDIIFTSFGLVFGVSGVIEGFFFFKN